jgi:hypothetical protein
MSNNSYESSTTGTPSSLSSSSNPYGTVDSDIINYSNSQVFPQSIIEKDRLNLLLTEINIELSRRGNPSINLSSLSPTIFSSEINLLASKVNVIPCSNSNKVTASYINKIINNNYSLGQECLCDCNYCTCNCNYCTCDCDYCTCNCDYCTCNCDYCTCDCNYGCTCDCNYAVGNPATPSYYDSNPIGDINGSNDYQNNVIGDTSGVDDPQT